MRDNRSVTPPPPQMPSSSYLSLSEQEPSRVDEPATSRKLLVLDLNGTLLHRAPHTFRPKSRTATVDSRKRDRHSNFLPRLRPVHPRPYMPAFRNYLFHSRTKEWLDVMVWSSAQPHSVGDMVDKCFEEHKDDLLAVWARDTLGLSNDHYFRKVQTVKDLAKPWSLLSPKPTDTLPSPHNSIASTPHTSPEPSSPLRRNNDSIRPAVDASPQAHSALTTLLLDDSPRKAELQPFNHVCIGEYSGEKRVKDLENLQKEQDLAAARGQVDAYIVESETVDATTAATVAATTITAGSGSEQATAADADVGQGESSKKRKRKEKKLQKRAALLEQMSNGEGKPTVIYDETLLAVIGVLGEIKSQANVAAWIRAGGLWGSHGPPASASESQKVEVVATTATTLPTSSKVTLDVLDAKAEDKAAAESDDSTLSAEEAKAGKRKKKRARVRGPTPVLVGDIERSGDVVAVGNDEVTAVPMSSLPVSETVAEPEIEEQKMWFEHADVFAYWAERGRKMLEELDIPVEHGIER
ncbi:hypothetical protein GSI_05254 [Ganoderma sinense ZZ0214-1]|uniref:Mitochondrial import inner membrane translocase subunit TIM50 n=1 Tax=Ganoderma sinense ZZ0214-1 TaxID=1077348 RepID=A0A2G8SFN2_9APHY|nr:hypothetical protein GSI_05254 [Ganoderma sinense ZZ0214-1]